MRQSLPGSAWLTKSLTVIFLILGWEGLARSGMFSPLVFPAFSAILAEFAGQIKTGFLLQVTAYSLSLVLKGLLISLAIALLLSSAAMMSKAAAQVVEVLNAIFHPLPGIALLPVAMLWFGLSEASILFIVAHSVVWPMVLNFLTGFRAIPPIILDVGKNIGLKGAGLMWGVMLPAASPYILSGIKIGWARAWRAAIAGEMVFGAVGAMGGLGWQIFKTRYDFNITGTFAALLAIMLIGILVEELLFKSIENNTIRRWGMSI